MSTGTRVLNGRYELGDLIGRGGMADVYRGTDLRLGRDVAVKILRADLARDPQFLARFRREAQSVAGLNHVSIVAVYDSGEEIQGDGVDGVKAPYIVMEIVQGETLKDLLKAGEVSVDQAVEYTLGVLAALEYSHKAGIVHRDIKPGNVMVRSDSGRVKVMDFGIARAVTDSSATMTQTQAVVGTAQYLSPEQALGETVDARSDLYSAGCLLYELLTGKPPFQGDSPVSVAYQHVQGIAVPPSKLNPDVSGALDSVVAKAMRKRREDRFPDAAAFRRALRAALGGVAVHDAPQDSTAANLVAVPADALTAAVEQPTTARHRAAGGAAGESTTALAHVPDHGAGHGSEAAADATPAPYGTAEDALTLTQDQLRVLLPEIRNLPEVQQAQRKHRRHRRGLMVTIWIFVLMVLGGAGFGIYSWLTRPIPVEMVAVPAVAQLTESAAMQKLYDARLQPKVTHVASATVPEGTAIETDPREGEMIEVNKDVKLVVSAGPTAVQIPDKLQGQSEAAVRDILRAAGLKSTPVTSFADSATVPANQVIATKPASGQTVPVNGAVQIIVSTGKVEVPELRGQTVDQATTVLEGLGLQVGVEEKDNAVVPEGQVTGQSVAAKDRIDQGGTVVLTVARKPTPPPTPSSTPSATPSGKPTADGG
ncbi:Stk1 family PASTA domain-containing Ser/Thr kinase [Arthrobacter woluwensis]|uniref:Stk1 family PASTA domain-containing Ser/Thr kinase n=1 Tax=Arthrobacter woluwensis TaxID=156980 RepID=UPI001AAF65B0|nr:Stk1 family PASTA domain-containing Ser/Thr kinase [Arthrobacter woluwensis]QTF73752.1 Stk1 family PASTA domain-containing Ser/Thr kinase [Arthrobacter woluwensis]